MKVKKITSIDQFVNRCYYSLLVIVVIVFVLVCACAHVATRMFLSRFVNRSLVALLIIVFSVVVN
jgi:hypothetical protein